MFEFRHGHRPHLGDDVAIIGRRDSERFDRDQLGSTDGLRRCLQEVAIMRMPIAALVLLGGCSPFCLPGPATQREPAAAPQVVQDSDSPLPLLVSVKDLMGGAIAFSAHVIDQVQASEAPMTNGDWGAARIASSDLIAAATLMTTPNNDVIDAVRRRDADWRSLAKALQDAGVNVAAASRAKDKVEFNAAVREMHAACLSCHAKYGVHGQ
jgi:hypothetical protein